MPLSPLSLSRRAGLTTGLRAALLGGVAAVGLLAAPAALQAQDAPPAGTVRVLTMNTWGDQFRNDLDAIAPLFINGNYDVIAFQELRNDAYLAGLQEILRDAGLGEYEYIRQGDSGVLSRIGGDFDTNTLGDAVAYQHAELGNGAPETVIGSLHLDYRDPSATRLNEAHGITEWALSTNRPVILTGDWNAGDVSERGLHRASQQKLILQNYLRSHNSFYGTLLEEYAVDPEAMADFIDAHDGENLSLDQIPDDLFADEMYPVENNTPVTMNYLKRNFILLQTEAEREHFAPHELGDGSVSWPSAEEDPTNTWPSWDRVRIDHFIASRPFGKWFVITDDPADAYTGTLDQTDVLPNGTAFTDHEVVAHDFRWVGPKLEYENEGTADELTRLVWSDEATTFAEGNEFFLTRNNMRTDVYLGQIADDNGNPILTGLTEAEKKTLLDCTSDEPRLAQAIVDYCIDDHSFIDETLVTSGGTVLVEEDAALGGSDATLRLSNGGLAVRGTAMQSLSRDVSLEGTGGWIEIRDAEGAVDAEGEITGTGALAKRGAGTLILSGDNSYTGTTDVEAGTLVVNGSTASSSLTTVMNGAHLGGNGTTGAVSVLSGGTFGAGNSIGALTVDGDLTFASGSTFEVETDEDGNADTVAVTGQVDILGGTALVIGEGLNYAPELSMQILTADGGLTGTFDQVNSTLAFLDADLAYGSNALTLQLARNDTAFDSVADTANGRAAAGGIESLGYGNALYNSVVMLGEATASAAFNSLSGELYAASAGALAGQSALVGGIAGTQLDAALDLAPGTTGFWLKGYGEDAEVDGTGDLRDLDRSATGTLLGVNGMLENGLTLGVMAGFGSSEASLDGLAGKADSDDTHFGLVAGQRFGQTAMTGGLLYTRSDVSVWRGADYAGTTEVLRGGYTADTTQVFAELSHELELGGTRLTPFAGLSHIEVDGGTGAETGGDAALVLRGIDASATLAELGLRAEHALGQGTTLGGELTWRHVMDGELGSADMAFAGGDTFHVEGTGLAEDVVTLGLSAAIAISDTASLSVGYQGRFGDQGSANAVTAGVGLRF